MGLIQDSKIKKKESQILRQFLLDRHLESQKLKEQKRVIPIEKIFLKIASKSIYKNLRLKKEKVSNSQKKEQFCHQLSRIIKFKHQGQVEICETSLINLSCQGHIKRKRTAKRRNVTCKWYEVK